MTQACYYRAKFGGALTSHAARGRKSSPKYVNTTSSSTSQDTETILATLEWGMLVVVQRRSTLSLKRS